MEPAGCRAQFGIFCMLAEGQGQWVCRNERLFVKKTLGKSLDSMCNFLTMT